MAAADAIDGFLGNQEDCDSTQIMNTSINKAKEHKARMRARARARLSEKLQCLVDRVVSAEAPSCKRIFMGICGPREPLGGLSTVDWDSLPESVDPARGGRLGAKAVSLRGQRKRWQVESLYAVLRVLVEEARKNQTDQATGDVRVAEIGCGSGNVALPLAALLPGCKFTLVDRNAYAVGLAKKRALQAGLANVDRFLACAAAELDPSEAFDVVVGMHACGGATDDAQRAALARGAAYLLVPCCVGKLKEGGDSAGARSRWLRGLLSETCASEEFLQLAAAADHQSHAEEHGEEQGAADQEGAGVDAGKVLGLVGAKDIVEADRSAAASEDHGYHTLVTKLFPVHSSPKNDVLVGAPPTKFGASAIQRLLAAASAHAGRAPASVRSSVSPQQDLPPPPPPEMHSGGQVPTNVAARGQDGYHVVSGLERGCSYYIRRKQRCCSKRAADGLSVCSDHTALALERERARCIAGPRLRTEDNNPKEGAGNGVGVGGSKSNRISATQRRMRNPFSASTTVADADDAATAPGPQFPDWRAVFADASKAVFVDVGSARGMFVETMATQFPQRNYLGVEIRSQLVQEALDRRAQGARNLHHITGNVLDPGWLAGLLQSLRDSGLTVELVAVQFPDPWTAAKHKRRRTVSAEVAHALSQGLDDGARVYVCSDVPAVVADAAQELGATPSLSWWRGKCAGEDGRVAISTDEDGWLLASPFGGGVVFSERDRVCEHLWRRVFRVMFVRREAS